jgi:hypothetical protein
MKNYKILTFYKFLSPNLEFFLLKTSENLLKNLLKSFISVQTFHQIVSHFHNLSTPNISLQSCDESNSIAFPCSSFSVSISNDLISMTLILLNCMLCGKGVKACVMNLTLCLCVWLKFCYFVITINRKLNGKHKDSHSSSPQHNQMP